MAHRTNRITYPLSSRSSQSKCSLTGRITVSKTLKGQGWHQKSSSLLVRTTLLFHLLSIWSLLQVSILDAGRNSLSFFLLLIVSLGLGVVKEELEFMNKCRILAGLHALFGIIYAIGMDLVELETVQGMVLLMFVIPLAVTMTTFLLWIMYGLTGMFTFNGIRS
jgi:hypothetical protein